ncbi:polysaccharide export outer membrane protein [Soonwooa buanensis]|uniref:Polysaccharide export outer membrane protein n=1 Tax=Soonwooa buanensis TaxID=619805 RepID=A0A1T5EUH1_9FLAO|nr:polysaccharide biosynthesis/export family protein [Soonwooa buanensis]SKB87459.1 polysaccharide export outer membrane protein [Soonwooa buanensis]
MKKVFYMVLLGVLCFNYSCKSKENINYLKNIENVAIEASYSSVNKTTIQPGDNLIIKVSANDMDVVKPFNQSMSSSETSQYSQSSTNLPTQAQTSVSGPTYTVDSNYDIDFPVIGVVNTRSKTIEELSSFLRDKVSRYVKNPSINIKNTNFKVTVLGEVDKPGYYMLPDGQTATIFTALGMAGDLTIYGERENVLLVRNVDGQMTKQYINLTDANLFNSDYFQLKQNDVIYVNANKAKQNSSWFGPQTGVWISVASVLVTILALVIKK